MRKLLFILIALSPLVGRFSPLSAQRLTIQKQVVECGRTGFQQPVTATFELRNKGLRRLVIESVKPDCGCTRVTYPKEVGIGEKFTIQMTYDAQQLGHFQKMVAVKSNATKKPIYLTMKGVVLSELQDYTGNYPYAMGELLLDKTDLEYDDVNMGDQPVQEIRIMNNGTADMQPRMMHLPSYLTATVTPETLQPGETGVISVMLRSDKLHGYGLTQSSVYLAQQLGEKVSRDNELSVSTVLLPDLKSFETIDKERAPRLHISTTDVDFTDFGGKTKKTADVVLFNDGLSPLQISSLQMFTGGLKITLGKREIEPGESTTLKITGFAEELNRLRKRPRILMITNDPNHAKVVININMNHPDNGTSRE